MARLGIRGGIRIHPPACAGLPLLPSPWCDARLRRRKDAARIALDQVVVGPDIWKEVAGARDTFMDVPDPVSRRIEVHPVFLDGLVGGASAHEGEPQPPRGIVVVLDRVALIASAIPPSVVADEPIKIASDGMRAIPRLLRLRAP